MESELEEQKNLNAVANNAELVATMVTAYRSALLEKGLPEELADQMALDFSSIYWEHFCDSFPVRGS